MAFENIRTVRKISRSGRSDRRVRRVKYMVREDTNYGDTNNGVKTQTTATGPISADIL